MALSAREQPPHESKPTAIMALVGMVALVSFNLYGGALPGNPGSLLVYYVLPGIGSVHLLYLGRTVWLPRQDVPTDRFHRADT
jgi:hypothetical protein